MSAHGTLQHVGLKRMSVAFGAYLTSEVIHPGAFMSSHPN
jgi:hypothetical protein